MSVFVVQASVNYLWGWSDYASFSNEKVGLFLRKYFVSGTNKGVCLTEECVRTGKFINTDF